MKQSLHNNKQSSVNCAQVFEFVGRFIWIQPLQYLAKADPNYWYSCEGEIELFPLRCV